ncbi:MAG: hypothetical protein ACYDB7_05395 [Mycobacteriales bacterium]
MNLPPRIWVADISDRRAAAVNWVASRLAWEAQLSAVLDRARTVPQARAGTQRRPAPVAP